MKYLEVFVDCHVLCRFDLGCQKILRSAFLEPTV